MIALSVLSHSTHLPLQTFPTRRSSDLITPMSVPPSVSSSGRRRFSRSENVRATSMAVKTHILRASSVGPRVHTKKKNRKPRSEEHTSELQSQSNLVCRLLLEKKKKDKK